MTPIVTMALLASLAAFVVPSTASLMSRQDNDRAAMCANWLIFTTNSGSICCPGVLQTHADEPGAQYCCVSNNIPNATFCGDHAETYDPQTASCSASFKVRTEGYTSSVLSAGAKYSVTRAVDPTPVTMGGVTSTSCRTVTEGVATGVGGATSMSFGLAQPVVTAPAFVAPVLAVGGLLLAL